ncbi:MAG: cupin domain-containing protein [Candidatus Methylomirabilales bacterium]
MGHKKLTDEIREQLAIYAMDALDETSAREWEAHLTTGCPVCRRELAEIRSTLALLPWGLPAVGPSEQVKTRLFERVRGSGGAVSELARAPRMIDFSLLDWQPSEHRGVSLHVLRHDQTTGTVMSLAKLQPGATYPVHRHPGGEDCLVLQGGFRDRRGEYRAGDFVYYESGSEHHDIQALEGDECVLLVVAHGGMELLPS